jgi:molybdopterin molybdotransferase
VCTVSAVAALLTVDEALGQVLRHARPLPAETVQLEDAAGRVLAEPALAVIDLPRFPSSAMDGYAVRAADTPGSLPIVDRVSAGKPAARALVAGEAMGIATGGVVPEGADAVVPVEQATETDGRVVVEGATVPGMHVRPRGGDVEAGAPVLPAGVSLTPSRLAALASAGVTHPRCHARPRVVIVTTGTELKRPGEQLGEGEIYESNGVMLSALVASAGGQVEPRRTVADDEASHREALAHGLHADVLVTSGGVSVGPHDLVRRTLGELGAEEVFWGVAMRPGKPLSFAVREATLAFGLPGNPVSSLVGALLFVVPALRALQGAADPAPSFKTGVLAASARRQAARDDYQRARIERSEGGTALRPVVGQESHMIVRAAAADALVHIPRGDGELAAGASVRYLELGAA